MNTSSSKLYKKNAFYKHNFKWWLGTELNRRHMDFQSIALPTELPSHHMAVLTGIEPAIFCVTGRRDKPLHYRTKWLRRKDSNQRPLGYEPNELTTAPLRDINGGGSRIRTRARSHACRFSRPIPSAGLGYSSVYIFFYYLVDPVGLEPTTVRL